MLGRTEIRSPSSGIVMGLQAHTTGGVIAPAQEILQVVPVGDRLVIEAAKFTLPPPPPTPARIVSIADKRRSA